MSTFKVCIASSREAEIGQRCRAWAFKNLPVGFVLTEDMDACEVFISVLYGKLVSEEFINRPGRRCFNFHPGALPAYRGSGAFSWAILNGDMVCGVTLHELDVDIDTGRVIERWLTYIEPNDTAETLFRRGMDGIFELFQRYFSKLLNGNYSGVPQDSDGARTYYRKQLQEQRDLTRYARAFHFEGKEQAFWRDRNGVKHYLTW